jgi:signal peptidase I
MTFIGWIFFFLSIQLIHFLGTWKLYQKAGKKPWQAIVPVYNALILMKIMNRPWWWVLLLFIPVINLLMFPVIWVETARSFGKNKLVHTLLAIFSLGFFNFYLNYFSKDLVYQENRSSKPTSELGEWLSSIVFAVIVATLVHSYFIQPYTIPTSSLEKSLLVGDFLFVSKFHYGVRTPMTPISAPMVHDTLPLINTKSYLYDDDIKAANTSWKNKLQLPYFRLPGIQDIKRNEIVVFNWPADTVRWFFDPSSIHKNKPIDKRSNYVKRCVGIPGDTLEIKGGYVYINGEKTVFSDRVKTQYMHIVEFNDFIDPSIIDRYHIKEYNPVYSVRTELWENQKYQKYIGELEKKNQAFLKILKKDTLRVELWGGIVEQQAKKLEIVRFPNKLRVNLTDAEALDLMKNTSVKSITKHLKAKDEFEAKIFPHSEHYSWNQDHYGPISIPKKGATVELSKEALPLYQRIIETYEGNELEIRDDAIYINGNIAKKYTFKQDYYWLMGDNRHNSEDARYWGYVPYDHVIGKPIFIWMSYDGSQKSVIDKIRWERLFTTVHGTGKPISFFWYFLGAIFIKFGYDYYRKRTKKE